MVIYIIWNPPIIMPIWEDKLLFCHNIERRINIGHFKMDDGVKIMQITEQKQYNYLAFYSLHAVAIML